MDAQSSLFISLPYTKPSLPRKGHLSETRMQSKHEDRNASVNTIFYWNGIFDPQGLTEVYGPIIDKLVSGNYQGLDLKKLTGYNVYSVRINHSDSCYLPLLSLRICLI
jgi:hypothetical protein